MSWTDERIGQLKKMWKEGKSAADIAKFLGKGVTRNAVIGKAHRMGLSGRPSPIKVPAPKKDPAKKAAAKPAPKILKPAEKKIPARVATKPKKEISPPVEQKKPLPSKGPIEPTRMEKEAPPPGGGVALIDLTERMCKWPIGDPREADFTFCGRGIRPGTPYCPDHAAAAYQSSSRSRAAAAAAAEEKDVDVVEVVDDDVETVA